MIAAYVSRLETFLTQACLSTPESRVLLAVSGGVDSVVMAYLFSQTTYKTGIAHANFGLRGADSDADASFVKQLADSSNNLPYYEERFDTLKHAKIKGISVQMAARELRYNWFHELCHKHGYASVALAQHQDDSLETMLINLTRGTGLSGLHGILPCVGRKIRPLLFLNRAEIKAIAKHENLAFREDASNSSDKYLRNALRLHVIPSFKQIEPKLAEAFMRSAQQIKSQEDLLQALVAQKKRSLFQEKDGFDWVLISALKKEAQLPTLLFELLRTFGFSMEVVLDLIKALDGISGKVFYSDTHQIIKDRKHLIISKKTKKKDPPFLEDLFTVSISTAVGFSIPKNKAVACFDADTLTFPLQLRYAKAADRFIPLGMQSHKKVSDLLIDNKVPMHQKPQTLVLISAGKIIWVLGFQISEAHKITPKTKRVYCLQPLASDFTK